MNANKKLRVNNIRGDSMNTFLEQARTIKEELIENRRTVHSNPEVGASLPKTKVMS